MSIRATVWGENVHETRDPAVAKLYPDGMHTEIAAALTEVEGVEARAVTQQEPENGLPQLLLDRTDVLFWWSHLSDDQVSEETVERVIARIHEGMGFVALHSALLARVFSRTLGARPGLRWRDANERERIWCADPSHPIADGVPESFELSQEEMYGEPILLPPPDRCVFLGWFAGGDACRAGMTWQRGAGRIFWFQPGHETVPTFYDPNVRRILRNAAAWATAGAQPATPAGPRHDPDPQPPLAG